jgi:D-glycero-D-manno-heptose 1,7-bisphosphate phosphatase
MLDRDGVINRKPPEDCYVRSWEEFEILPGVPEAIRRLNDLGITVIVVTNQRGIALGLYTRHDVDYIHSMLIKYLKTFSAEIAAFYYCPHDRASCSCRKPEPGLLKRALHDFPKANSGNCLMVGDSLSDIRAGQRLDMRCAFIRGDERKRQPGFEEALATATVSAESLHGLVETYF